MPSPTIQRQPPVGDLWTTEDGDVYWVRGAHTEAMRWQVRRYWMSEWGTDTIPRCRRVWIVAHICDQDDDEYGCWCASCDGPDGCIDEVPKGTPGAVSAWRIS